MRILHVTPYSAGAWAYGGIPRLVDSLTRGLARRGHHVTVCATDVCDETGRLAALAPAIDGVDVRVFRNLSNRLAYQAQLFLPCGLHRYLAREARHFDVAHLHACRNLPGAIAAYHLRRAGVPYLLAPNGTAPRIERRRFAKLAFDMIAGERMLDGAAFVLAVSGAEHAQLTALGVPPSAIRIIPNPLNLDEFASPITRGAFRRRFNLSSAPLVLFLGKITPRKRLDVLVRAFASVRADAQLVIAGNDMGGSDTAKGLIATLGFERRTRFTGLLRDRGRLEALADADVVVYPSEHEIFGLVPLEALLAGSPVIVADDCGCGEVVRGTGGGLVVPAGDVDVLRRAIDTVLSDPEAWREAATAGAARVRAAYGADAVGARIDRLYSEMVAEA